jgi:serine/threonine protein kinase
MSYKLSPQPASNTSHEITSATGLANVPIQEALSLAKQKAKKVFRFDPLRYGAKKLGGGAYGTAYLVQITPAVLAGLQEGLAYGGGRIVTSMPGVGERVVVKIATQGGKNDAAFYQENIRENIVHKRFSVDPCRPVPRAQKPICVSKYVPKFYLSFIDGTPKKHESVTVMGLAGDMSLAKFIGSKKIPVDFYVDLERAICSMWLAGYLHGDLHRENIMIDTRTKRIQIIDFGFALKMPPGFIDVLSRRISNMISSGKFQTLGDVWTEKPVDGKLRLINYSDRVMKGRGFPWYNPDYKILRSLWNQVPRDMRKKIPAARSALWGIPIVAEQDRRAARPKTSRPKTMRQRSATPQRMQKSPSPVLRASAAKTYRSSQTSRPMTTSLGDKQAQMSKSPSPLVQKSKSPSPFKPVQKQKSPSPFKQMQKPKSPSPFKQMQKPKSPSPFKQMQKPKSPSPFKQMQKPKSPGLFARKYKSPHIPTPLRSLSDAERAAVYGRRSPQDKVLADIQQRKIECQRRGMMYNPITKSCTQQVRQGFGGCREDCARVGKRCGPRGKCVKL